MVRTRQFSIRKLPIHKVLLSALVFAAVPPVAIGAASNGAEYVGGTVKSIPVNSEGTLDFSDAKEFRFNYEGAVYHLPYSQITGTDVESVEVRHIMHVIPAESLLFSHRKRTLVINYTDSTGAPGTLNFELMAYRAAEAKDAIAAKKSPVLGANQSPDDWWGDIYWKTKRNQAAWDARAAQNAQNALAAQQSQVPPAGTK
ncbi:MAG: hypothetical protein JOZ32_04210 [Bryobacterales bacterium]|nr:hypothetical protein [Bryobacterales bacterium]